MYLQHLFQNCVLGSKFSLFAKENVKKKKPHRSHITVLYFQCRVQRQHPLVQYLSRNWGWLSQSKHILYTGTVSDTHRHPVWLTNSQFKVNISSDMCLFELKKASAPAVVARTGVNTHECNTNFMCLHYTAPTVAFCNVYRILWQLWTDLTLQTCSETWSHIVCHSSSSLLSSFSNWRYNFMLNQEATHWQTQK